MSVPVADTIFVAAFKTLQHTPIEIELALRQTLGVFGQIRSINSHGKFAFVVFKDPLDAQNALNQGPGMKCYVAVGNELVIRPAAPPKPSSGSSPSERSSGSVQTNKPRRKHSPYQAPMYPFSSPYHFPFVPLPPSSPFMSPFSSPFMPIGYLPIYSAQSPGFYPSQAPTRSLQARAQNTSQSIATMPNQHQAGLTPPQEPSYRHSSFKNYSDSEEEGEIKSARKRKAPLQELSSQQSISSDMSISTIDSPTKPKTPKRRRLISDTDAVIQDAILPVTATLTPLQVSKNPASRNLVSKYMNGDVAPSVLLHKVQRRSNSQPVVLGDALATPSRRGASRMSSLNSHRVGAHQ